MEARHDVLIVGAGCAGMRAAIEAFDAGADVALLSKIHALRNAFAPAAADTGAIDVGLADDRIPQAIDAD